MNEKMFNELIASIEEGGAILRGEIKPSRQFHIDSVDVKRIRENYKLTQVEKISPRRRSGLLKD